MEFPQVLASALYYQRAPKENHHSTCMHTRALTHFQSLLLPPLAAQQILKPPTVLLRLDQLGVHVGQLLVGLNDPALKLLHRPSGGHFPLLDVLLNPVVLELQFLDLLLLLVKAQLGAEESILQLNITNHLQRSKDCTVVFFYETVYGKFMPWKMWYFTLQSMGLTNLYT